MKIPHQTSIANWEKSPPNNQSSEESSSNLTQNRMHPEERGHDCPSKKSSVNEKGNQPTQDEMEGTLMVYPPAKTPRLAFQSRMAPIDNCYSQENPLRIATAVDLSVVPIPQRRDSGQRILLQEGKRESPLEWKPTEKRRMSVGWTFQWELEERKDEPHRAQSKGNEPTP